VDGQFHGQCGWPLALGVCRAFPPGSRRVANTVSAKLSIGSGCSAEAAGRPVCRRTCTSVRLSKHGSFSAQVETINVGPRESAHGQPQE
jgi:hypothetical protein